jgi:hypothetical protein
MVKAKKRVRIIYYFFLTEQQIRLMTLYDKDEAAELTPKEKGMLKEATLRRVESSMAIGGTRDRVNADDGLLPGIRRLLIWLHKNPLDMS